MGELKIEITGVDEEDEYETIGVVTVDNGAAIDVVLTPNGIRYGFSDVRDMVEYGGDGGEMELFKSVHSVIGIAEERGFQVRQFTLMDAVKTLAVTKVRDALDVSFDKAKELLEG